MHCVRYVAGSGVEILSARGTSSDTLLASGGREVVSAGGYAAFTTAAVGGTVQVDSGGELYRPLIGSGGSEFVASAGETFSASVYGGVLSVGSGGFDDFTVVSRGGVDVVGGSASGTTLEPLGLQLVVSGGVANATTIENGGIQVVEAGGTTSNTVVSWHGIEIVESGGTADPTTVTSGGLLMVLAGGSDPGAIQDTGGLLTSGDAVVLQTPAGSSGWATSASGVVVSGPDVLYVAPGGSANAAIVSANGYEVVIGGTDSGATLSGGYSFILDGGIASATDAAVNGQITVGSGGTTVSAALYSGSVESVLFGGLASATHVDVSGTQYVEGGRASGTIVSGDALVPSAVAQEVVWSGGDEYGTVVEAGGSDSVQSGGAAFHDTVDASGNLTVLSGGTAFDTTISGGTATVASAGAATGYVDFQGSGGVLELAGTLAPAATIGGFVNGDTIDLLNVASVGGGTAVWTSGSGLLTVTEGGVVEVLKLDPSHNYTGDTFTPSFDGAAGTDITVTCFCAGTRIATPGGEVDVERLRIGDLVSLADGRALPVRWLGRQTVSRRFADPLRTLPIRIAAGALGPQTPTRDLLVSPGHALLLGGLLVQAGALMDLAGVSREHSVADTFVYWHVELDEHALLLAEGVATESYLDGCEDVAFDNRDERPGREAAAELPYPRVKSARQLSPQFRRRVGARAA